MRETVGSSVSATERLSILKPRPLKSPATRASTPNSFSTRTDIVWRIYETLPGGSPTCCPRERRCRRGCRCLGAELPMGAMLVQDLHDAVFSLKLALLELLALVVLL